MFSLSIIAAQTEETVETLTQGAAIIRQLLGEDYRLEVTPVDSSGFLASDVTSVALTLTDSSGGTSELIAPRVPIGSRYPLTWIVG